MKFFIFFNFSWHFAKKTFEPIQRHAKALLEKMKAGIEIKEEEKESGCGCSGSVDRKNSPPPKKEEPKEKELPKPDDTYPDKRYNQEILIPKGFFLLCEFFAVYTWTEIIFRGRVCKVTIYA